MILQLSGNLVCYKFIPVSLQRLLFDSMYIYVLCLLVSLLF